jgi:hypothetical protein
VFTAVQTCTGQQEVDAERLFTLVHRMVEGRSYASTMSAKRRGEPKALSRGERLKSITLNELLAAINSWVGACL